jgi:hypothetical protein
MVTSDPAPDRSTRRRTWAAPTGPKQATSTSSAGGSAASTVVTSLTAAGPSPRRRRNDAPGAGQSWSKLLISLAPTTQSG